LLGSPSNSGSHRLRRFGPPKDRTRPFHRSRRLIPVFDRGHEVFRHAIIMEARRGLYNIDPRLTFNGVRARRTAYNMVVFQQPQFLGIRITSEPRQIIANRQRAFRRSPRTRASTAARIIVGHCSVRNISTLGAQLEFKSTNTISSIFALTFDAGRTLRACHVIWRTDAAMGIEFRDRKAA